MGTWKIEIEGQGIHHNKRADDANEMAAEFARALRRDGHEVTWARFAITNGDGSLVSPAEDVIDRSGPIETSEPLLTNEPIMQHFSFAHLPPHLQAASKPFCDLARRIVETTPRNAERTVALRKVLEAKDAGVRAMIAK